jgi:hypothetical protein
MRAFAELAMDRLWVRNMDELDIEKSWPAILDAASAYDRMILISDDGVVRQHALDAVVGLLDDGRPVVTGYSNLDATDLRVNLNRIPLLEQSEPDQYDFYTLGEVLCWPDRAVPTTFCGFALTGMSRELWARFPFNANYGSDFSLSRRLGAQGIPIVGARDAFVWHVKEKWNQRDQDPRKHSHVALYPGDGSEPAAIELEVAA